METENITERMFFTWQGREEKERMAAIGRRETSENRRGKMRCRLSGKALGKSSDEVELVSSDDLTMKIDQLELTNGMSLKILT